MVSSDSSATTYALAFETSTAVGRVALGADGRVVAVRELSQPRAHAVEFLPAVASMCGENGVSPSLIGEVYVSAGPGSFTGLRIGITAARMLAFAVGARVAAVPTLEVVAQNALDAPTPPGRVVVVLDAKRARVYTCAFERCDDKYMALGPPIEADPSAFLAAQPSDCAVLGEGVAYHRAAIEQSGRPVLDPNLYPPRVQTVFRLGWERARRGEFVNPKDLIPTYIRPPEAEEKWALRHTSGSA